MAMREIERRREPVSAVPDASEMERKEKDGWRLVALEWERETDHPSTDEKRPIPFGLRIASDCQNLEVDPTEKEVLSIIIAMIAEDHPLSKIAAELNQRGYRTRRSSDWTQLQVFQLLPRVIEFGPEVLSERDWSQSKRRVLEAVS
jgi:Recombinase